MTAPAAAVRRATTVERAAIALALLAAFTIIWVFRLRGWVAHDEGTLGQSAERVLLGQIPHRDFDDPYTGGLALLHALVFKLFGVSLSYLRTTLAAVASLWLAGIAAVAEKWLTARGVVPLVLLLATWGVALYPAAMPSWYVLFLTTGSGAALFLLGHAPRRAAAVAGAAIGIAALFKVTAFFALGGAACAIIALHQLRWPARRGAPEVLAVACAGMLIVIKLLFTSLNIPVVVHLALPAVAAFVAVGLRELEQGRSNGWRLDFELWSQWLTLAAGAAIPVAVFALWLGTNGGLAPFLASLANVVGRRAEASALMPPSWPGAVVSLGVLVALVRSRGVAVWVVLCVGAAVVAEVVMTSVNANWHVHLWNIVRGVMPAGLLLFAWWWRRAGIAETPAVRAVAIFAPLAGVMALTQFPFSAPIYFLYVFPLAAIALSAALVARSADGRLIAVCVAGMIAVAAVEVLPGAPENLAMYREWHEDRLWLDAGRAHLLIPVADQHRYARLAGMLDSLPAGPIWAGPDAPEVAFLAGRQDLNPEFFAFLGPALPLPDDSGFLLFGEHAVAVVIDTAPSFSPPLSAGAIKGLSTYFPRMIAVDQFRVYMRAAP